MVIQMQIAICDDEKEVREMMENKVHKVCPEADIYFYESGEELLLTDKQMDILFLDIQMPGKNGMDTARELAFIAVSCWLLLRVYVYKKDNITKKELFMLIMPSLSGVIGYKMLQYYQMIYEADTGKSLYRLFGTYDVFKFLHYGISFITILVMIVVFQNIKGRQEEKWNERLSEQIENMKIHISEVEKLYQDIRSLKHDMGNHVMTLENLCGKNEYEEAEKYVLELKQKFSEVSFEIKSGNPVTDVILTEKQKEAKEKEIDFACVFHYPEETKINAFDVSVILNNAITNAMEGTDGCNNPYVRISSYRKNNAYMIVVKNSFKGKIMIDEESGLPKTSKNDKSSHGFGLMNIRKVAQKYYGDIDINQKENCFTLSIMLMVE
jgi:hypothetical protein